MACNAVQCNGMHVFVSRQTHFSPSRNYPLMLHTPIHLHPLPSSSSAPSTSSPLTLFKTGFLGSHFFPDYAAPKKDNI